MDSATSHALEAMSICQHTIQQQYRYIKDEGQVMSQSPDIGEPSPLSDLALMLLTMKLSPSFKVVRLS